MASSHYNQYQYPSNHYTQAEAYGPRHGEMASVDDFSEHGPFNMPAGSSSRQHLNDGPGSYSTHSAPLTARERYMQRKQGSMGAAVGAGAGAGAGAAGVSAFEDYGEKPANYSSPGRRCDTKWFWWIGAIVMAILLAVGIGLGVHFAKANSSSSDSTADVVKSDSSDPSKFTKDSRLKQSFYGICYTPLNSQYPACGSVQANVTEDIQLLSQLTPRLRLYGADCNVSEFVLTAIEETKVNMTAYLALWVDDDAATWERQFSETKTVLTKHGVDHVDGLIVGNEYILDGGNVTYLLEKVSEVRTWVESQNYSKNLTIGTADAGSSLTTTMAEGVDVLWSNEHAWFAGTTVADAAGWTWSYTNDNIPYEAVSAATNNPELIVAETGWPTNANDTADLTYEGAVAGTSELQTFLDTFICAANQNITAQVAAGENLPSSKYYFFEAFDEPWKSIYGGVEPYWGLFDSNKELKNITIPDCQAP